MRKVSDIRLQPLLLFPPDECWSTPTLKLLIDSCISKVLIRTEQMHNVDLSQRSWRDSCSPQRKLWEYSRSNHRAREAGGIISSVQVLSSENAGWGSVA